jgi:transposase
MLSLMNMVSRNKAVKLSGDQIKRLSEEDLEDLFNHPFLVLSASSSLSVVQHLTKEILRLEKEILKVGKLKPAFNQLIALPGIGQTIGLTIAFEVGTLHRFEDRGDYLSYCRCVDSKRLSNGKKKGENNRKSGNKYLAWAYVEAANFAKRHCPYAKAYFNHKLKESGYYVLAIKALASKIARATYFMMTRGVDYDPEKVFGNYKKQALALIKKQKP